ncbi:hypothetical protein DS745_03600 [Anaerobacillus alkaliphilus]|uniref:Uncharacterized protein n=1 Tax=Anaerobacillus alkaliphilus TaxID=1548597 RepID=A0A4Q0VY38_9BACI|nr:hypothetical protein DS745_03600 [Anaerobacillus alkaliphilus]
MTIKIYEKKWNGVIHQIKLKAFQEGDRKLTAAETKRIREIESVYIDTISLTNTYKVLIELRDDHLEQKYINDFKVAKAALGLR